jgi:hypothetical protein
MSPRSPNRRRSRCGYHRAHLRKKVALNFYDVSVLTSQTDGVDPHVALRSLYTSFRLQYLLETLGCVALFLEPRESLLVSYTHQVGTQVLLLMEHLARTYIPRSLS